MTIYKCFTKSDICTVDSDHFHAYLVAGTVLYLLRILTPVSLIHEFCYTCSSLWIQEFTCKVKYIHVNYITTQVLCTIITLPWTWTVLSNEYSLCNELHPNAHVFSFWGFEVSRFNKRIRSCFIHFLFYLLLNLHE